MLQEYIQIQKRMNTAGIAKESNNEIPNMKENCWTQDKEIQNKKVMLNINTEKH